MSYSLQRLVPSLRGCYFCCEWMDGRAGSSITAAAESLHQHPQTDHVGTHVPKNADGSHGLGWALRWRNSMGLHADWAGCDRFREPLTVVVHKGGGNTESNDLLSEASLNSVESEVYIFSNLSVLRIHDCVIIGLYTFGSNKLSWILKRQRRQEMSVHIIVAYFLSLFFCS